MPPTAGSLTRAAYCRRWDHPITPGAARHLQPDVPPARQVTSFRSASWAEVRSIREHVSAVLDEERVVVALVFVRRVVLGTPRSAVGDVFFGVDRADRAHVWLIAVRA